jgi:N-acetylneuraminate synthase
VDSFKTLVIAEAGVNHNGDVDTALSLVDAAADAGADFVKFQTFKADRIASPSARQASYQVRNTGTEEPQIAMLRRLELSEEAHEKLVKRCRERNVAFLSTPFDLESLSLLVGRFDLPLIKLSSGDLTNGPLLLAAARTQRPIVLSTGMSTIGEVEEALGVLAFGYSQDDSSEPSHVAFHNAYADTAARAALARNVTLLHCTTQYPTPFESVNLRAMDTLRAAFGLPVGYSDHTEGITVPIAAVARGAAIVEKHFTLDRSMPGPDHKASLEPAELAAMVTSIRQVEAAIGSGIKFPQAAERANVEAARKSIVAAHEITAGAVLRLQDLTTMRPGSGLSPMGIWDAVGRLTNRSYKPGELLDK